MGGGVLVGVSVSMFECVVAVAVGADVDVGVMVGVVAEGRPQGLGVEGEVLEVRCWCWRV